MFLKMQATRIHMALVCATVGCPPLRAAPFRAAELDAQLTDQARRFFAQPDKFRLDARAGTVFLSPLFQWFAELEKRLFSQRKVGKHLLRKAGRTVVLIRGFDKAVIGIDADGQAL